MVDPVMDAHGDGPSQDSADDHVSASDAVPYGQDEPAQQHADGEQERQHTQEAGFDQQGAARSYRPSAA